ncbi:hypothetical protein B0H14DRAFT_3053219 [Mycena olivaceomarginata]|nr:hypothetical protein B0H14DRAFT_3053219 [Mycena olivaceomarginata]
MRICGRRCGQAAVLTLSSFASALVCLTRHGLAVHVVNTTSSAQEQLALCCASPAPEPSAVLVHIFRRSLGLVAESLLLQAYEWLRSELL